jgi:uncharacterized protein YodC (DUF2158 family)
MDLKPGDVVILRSGGHPMTVAEVNGDTILGVWMGGEGDLFRETLPMACWNWRNSKFRMKRMRTKRKKAKSEDEAPLRAASRATLPESLHCWPAMDVDEARRLRSPGSVAT